MVSSRPHADIHPGIYWGTVALFCVVITGYFLSIEGGNLIGALLIVAVLAMARGLRRR